MALLTSALVALSLLGGGPSADDSGFCSLATALDLDPFASRYKAQEYPDQRPAPDVASAEAARVWSDCRAADLSASLRRTPGLRAHIAQLRTLFQALRGSETQIDAAVSGGGSGNNLAPDLAQPDIETTLARMAALLDSPAQNRVSRQSSLAVAAGVRVARARLTRVRALRPDPLASTATQAELNVQVARYAQTLDRLMVRLGTRGDAATALGYALINRPLYLDDGTP